MQAYRKIMLKCIKKHIFESIKYSLKEINYFFFICIWISLTIYEFILLKCFDFIDPIGNPKYFLLCNITLAAYSLICSHAYKTSKTFYISTLIIPFVLLLMELINFYSILPYDTYAQILFFLNIYHFTLFGIIWFLIFDLCIHNSHIPIKIRKTVIHIQIVLEILILWLACSIILNAIFNSGIDKETIIAICQTNFDEAWQYFWGRNHGLALVSSMIILLFFISIFVIKSKRFSFVHIPYKPYQFGTFTLLSLCMVLIIILIGIRGNMYTYYRPLTWRILKSYGNYKNSIVKHKKLISQRKLIVSQYANENVNKNDIILDGLYVLIIGESLNRQYMGCYNPYHNTTPFQQQLKSNGAIFFERIYACDVYTTKVIPMMLTLHNQYNFSNEDDNSETELSLSLLDIAQANSFEVYWISNQTRISNNNSLIPIIAETANKCVYASDLHLDNDYDQNLLAILEATIFSPRSLVIIHLIGNHYPYHLRFPKDFIFPSGLAPYEKSVYYNDYIIKELVNFFQSKGASIISYVSDHSEAVSVGKGHDSRPDVFCREMIEIPMWFWISEEYRQKYPLTYQTLKMSSKKVITNDLLINLFMDLMHLPVTKELGKYSPLSSDYILDKNPPKSLEGKYIIPSP